MPYPTSFTAQHIAAATDLYQELAKEHELRLVVLSGSLAFGLGHGTSDVDLHMLAGSGGGPEARFHLRRDLPVQINLVSPAKFTAAVEWAASDAGLTSADRSSLNLPEDVRMLAIRLARGHVLHADNECAQALGRLNEDVIRRRQAARHALRVNNYQEDVAGALLSGDQDTAYTATRIALAHGCEALLAAFGDPYIGDKFLLRRLRRVTAIRPLLPEIFRGLDIPPVSPDLSQPLADVGDKQFAQLLHSRLRLAAFMGSHAVLDGWDTPMTSLPSYALDTGGPLRDPYFTVIRFSDGIGLAGPDKGYRVSAEAARLWLSLDGRKPLDSNGPDDDPITRGTRQLIQLGAGR